MFIHRVLRAAGQTIAPTMFWCYQRQVVSIFLPHTFIPAPPIVVFTC